MDKMILKFTQRYIAPGGASYMAGESAAFDPDEAKRLLANGGVELVKTVKVEQVGPLPSDLGLPGSGPASAAMLTGAAMKGRG